MPGSLPTNHDIDLAMLGYQPDEDPARIRFPLTMQLCRPDGALYGGTALLGAFAAMELATGRPALWANVQLASSARVGEILESEVEVTAAGRMIDQVWVTARAGDRIVWTGVGSTATWKADGIEGTGPAMPQAAPPQDCEPMQTGFSSAGWAPAGYQQICQHLEAPLAAPRHRGHFAFWARVPGVERTTAAKLGFLADMVPLAACRAAGVLGAGTSLDQALRIGRLVDSEWVLLEMEGFMANGGLGHGSVHVWSSDGVLMATGTQSAKLFDFASFAERLRLG